VYFGAGLLTNRLIGNILYTIGRPTPAVVIVLGCSDGQLVWILESRVVYVPLILNLTLEISICCRFSTTLQALYIATTYKQHPTPLQRAVNSMVKAEYIFSAPIISFLIPYLVEDPTSKAQH
jgi:hypothetical protein